MEEHDGCGPNCYLCKIEQQDATIADLRAELETVESTMLTFKDEAAALRAEVEFWQKHQINNPCSHTGFESFVCEKCGYPDPRKTISTLRDSVARHGMDLFKLTIEKAALRARVADLEGRVERIKNWRIAESKACRSYYDWKTFWEILEGK